jgi:hypothetical protein
MPRKKFSNPTLHQQQLEQLRALRQKNTNKMIGIGRSLAARIAEEKDKTRKLDIISGEKSPVDYEEARKIGRELARNGSRTSDIAAEIADAIFVANPAPIYEAMLKKLLQGDSKVFSTLAARAYGEPLQEVINHQSKPFELVVTHIGRREEPRTIEGEITESEPAGDLPPTEAVDAPGTLGR